MEWIVGLVVAFVAIVALGVVGANRQERRAKDIEDRIRELKDFAATDIFVSTENFAGIAIDVRRRRLLLADETAGLRQFEASQVISCEILQDEVQLAFVNRGSQLARAAVGGILLGGAGAAIGALTASKRGVDNVRKVILRLVTDDFNRPIHDMVLLDWSIRKKGIKRTNFLYRQSLEVAELWHGRVIAMLKAEESGA